MKNKEKKDKQSEIVSHSDLVIGMRITDNDGNVGIVKDCDDLHNVFVEYDNGGSGFHCLIEECIETTSKLVDIPQYDHLYYVVNVKK
jgi:hypothetical protein